MDEILHTPREESSAIRPPLAQLRDRWEAGTAALAQRVEPLRRRLDAATAGGRRLINPLHFLAAAVVIGVAAVVGTVYTPSYVVEVDGVALGTVTSPSVFEDVVDRVESRATDILGYDYTMDGAVTYAPALTERESITPVADFETYLFDQIGEVMKSYVLTVNGQFIGAAQDRETLNGVLEQVKAAYVDENTVSAEFTSGVYITHEYTPSDVNQDPAAMLATLTANTNGQTTYEVQKGDTFNAIAYANDMSVSDLKALNPGIDINRLMIGDVLNVKEQIPLLSVTTVDDVTYTEPIACPVEEVKDSSMYVGDSKILTQGTEGEAQVHAQVTYVNGSETQREILSSTTLREPTTTVKAVGTKEKPKTASTGSYSWPIRGRITSYFGGRNIFGSYSYHSGIDISASYGAAIKAADGGTVTFAGYKGSYGYLVIITHDNGTQTYYGHNSSLLVSAGQKVYKGQQIAKAGSTGRSTGTHCHFEVRVNGTSVNPLSYLS